MERKKGPFQVLLVVSNNNKRKKKKREGERPNKSGTECQQQIGALPRHVNYNYNLYPAQSVIKMTLKKLPR